MCRYDRRAVLALGIAGLGVVVTPRLGWTESAKVSDAARRHFIAEAERMRLEAVRAGDQSYGAVLTRGDEIVGWGPSRVVTDRNASAHAERVAIRDAMARLGTKDLSGCVLYSTSRPCSACEAAAAQARVARMYWGPRGTDAGVPGG